jgi:hypothetical protein
MNRLLILLLVAVASGIATFATGADPQPQELVEKVIAAAGGKERVLTLFRFKERLNVSSDAAAKGSERTSVVEPPRFWWIGASERGGEPAKYLVWAWTLGALTDEKSKFELIPTIKEQDAAALGLRVSQTIDPPLDLYFDEANLRLVRIDWRGDIHRFSQWSEQNGIKFPARCVGYRKSTGKPWYYSEILELEPLTELPEGLKR